MYKLGIDVGGTNTDAVLIDENLKVVAAVKNPTSGDIYEGIMGAVDAVLAQANIDRKLIKQAMLGTTQCTNAIVERKGLAPIAILRIGAPASVGIPPMVDWSDDIAAVAVDTAIIGGGFEFDGKRLADFDEAACRAFFEGVKGKVESVAISCVFAGVRNDDELAAAAIAREVLGDDVRISISSEIGSMGLVERENATILNAALHLVAERFTEGFAKSLAERGITEADVYLSQNDGTLMTIDHARRYPILTIACGPTNSIRGASYLSRMDDAIVIDVGGTTTDLGVIQNGFPRESSVAVTIGGVRTNFRMPDVVSIAWAAAPSSGKDPTAPSPWARIPWAIRSRKRPWSLAATCAPPPTSPCTWVWLSWGPVPDGPSQRGFCPKGPGGHHRAGGGRHRRHEGLLRRCGGHPGGRRLPRPAGGAGGSQNRGQARRGRRGQRHRFGPSPR